MLGSLPIMGNFTPSIEPLYLKKGTKVVDKLIIEGRVAVLVSHGYGAGWYSWECNEAMLFDPILAQALLGGKTDAEITRIAKQRYPNQYLGGLDGLTVHWVPLGTEFRINEYDGSEALMYKSDYHWLTA
jgi:hypothetical protein